MCLKSIDANEEIVSTNNKAGCFAASIAFLISASLLQTPVDVSLWTTKRAFILCSLSFDNFSSTIFGSTPVLQSPATKSTSSLKRLACSYHKDENWPVSNIKTLSPSLKVFTIAASHAPVPEEGKIITGSSVLKISFTLSNTLLAISANTGPL